MPAGIRRMIDDMVEPKINWRDLIKQTVQSSIKDDFTFNRTSRRTQGSGIFLPTLKKDDTIDVAVAIDMSGSISDAMAADFLAEVRGIMDEYDEFELSIVCFDTQAHAFKKFTKDTADDIQTYECKGGGGTDFMAFWDYWIENEIDPKVAVIFTDGYCSSNGPNQGWGPNKYVESVIWVITGAGHSPPIPPFGTYALFDHDSGVTEIGEAG